MDGSAGAAYAGRGASPDAVGGDSPKPKHPWLRRGTWVTALRPPILEGSRLPPTIHPLPIEVLPPIPIWKGDLTICPAPFRELATTRIFSPPLELQQTVAAIPSEDMILPEAPPSYYDVPPELLEAVQNLPSDSDPAGSGVISPGPSPDRAPAQTHFSISLSGSRES